MPSPAPSVSSPQWQVASQSRSRVTSSLMPVYECGSTSNYIAELGSSKATSTPPPAPWDDRPLTREIKPSRKRDFKKRLLGRRKAEGNKQAHRKHVFPSVMPFLWKPSKHTHTVSSLGVPGAFFLAKKKWPRKVKYYFNNFFFFFFFFFYITSLF